MLHLAKWSFRNEEEIKTFSETEAKGIHHHWTCLTILKGVLQAEIKGC